MMKRKAFWVLLAAGMTVVSTGVVSAQWVDHETLTRMISGAAGSQVAESPPAAPRRGTRGVSTKNSLVGSWQETVTFEGDRPPLKSLITFHDDGTMEANDQGSVTLQPPSVTTSGVGVWTRLKSRVFAYTQHNLFSDLSGNFVGSLKVRGTYTLIDSGDRYEGTSFFEVFDANGDKQAEGSVTNKGERIDLELQE